MVNGVVEEASSLSRLSGHLLLLPLPLMQSDLRDRYKR